MERRELQEQLALARRSFAEIEGQIARQRELIKDSERRGVDPGLSAALLNLFTQMRVLRALHVQYVSEELQKRDYPPYQSSRSIYGILAVGRVTARLVDPIPTRIPD